MHCLIAGRATALADCDLPALLVLIVSRSQSPPFLEDFCQACRAADLVGILFFTHVPLNIFRSVVFQLYAFNPGHNCAHDLWIAISLRLLQLIVITLIQCFHTVSCRQNMLEQGMRRIMRFDNHRLGATIPVAATFLHGRHVCLFQGSLVPIVQRRSLKQWQRLALIIVIIGGDELLH